MIVKGIHHVAIIVSSEASVDFYKKLGFKETFRKEREYDTVVLMEGLGIELEVFIDPNHPQRSKTEPMGLRHLAFHVDNCDQMRNEFDCGPIKKDWIGRNYCFTADPDGNTVEYHE